jgi:alpha/beta superfamily hydrolase
VSESAPPTVTFVEFESVDGAELVGDLAASVRPIAAAIVCHPHPQYGGNRFNNVVSAVFGALPAVDIAVLRVDFRQTFDHGVGERLDAVAALDELARVCPDVPLVAIGYSFGAIVALGLGDPRVSAKVLIAPPLAMATDLGRPTVPTLVLTPRHDQFSPPPASDPIVASWSDEMPAVAVDHRVIESADHSLVGRTAAVSDQVTSWLTGQVAG